MYRHQMQLATYMRQHGISDAALAELVRCNRVTISRLRRGTAAPSLSLAKRLAEVSNGAVTPNDFLAAPAKQEAAA